MKKLTEKPVVHSLADSHNVFLNAGGSVAQMPVSEFREQMNQDDARVLNDLAFYIDVNKASSLGSNRVDVGGNLGMFSILEGMRQPVLMDKHGNFFPLSKVDGHYAIDGTQVADPSTHAAGSTYANLDFMEIIPEYYGRIQLVTIGNTTFPRCWFSPVPLPGGYVIKQQVVGKFKCAIVSGALRSIPGVVTADSRTVRGFWDLAQVRSKDHGLAGLKFRRHLLVHMMGKYAWRDSQNCKTQDGTLVWGVGLDGTENTSGSSADGFSRQRNIVTGAALSLGEEDGKVAVLDSEGGTCHSVSVAGFADPWGQKWEMAGDLCSVGNDVYHWDANFVPSGTPTADTFNNIDHVKLTRKAGDGFDAKVNIVSAQEGQGIYPIPIENVSGITYGDYYWYNASGQLWLFGGSSSHGSKCGLAYAHSADAWSSSSSDVSARLAYYGKVTQVASLARLVELAAA